MPFGSLWIPVVLSGISVFALSSIAHMVIRHHRADYKGLPNEGAFVDVVRKQNLPPGLYAVPYCPDPKQMKEPSMQEGYAKGPVGLFAVLPNGAPAMGAYLSQWFGFCLLISFVCAYIARHTLAAGADGLLVMRITGAIAFTGYGMSSISNSIWMGQPWSNTFRTLGDAVVYSIATGLLFRLFWPH